MSKYRTHNWFNILLILPLCLILGYFFLPKHLIVLFAIVFIYGTLIMSPDCDIAHKTNPYSIRGVLLYPFRYYSRVFSHRGISHAHIVGTFTRIIWLLIFFTPIGVFLFFTSPEYLSVAYLFLYHHPVELGITILALIISDSSHIFLDRI